MEEERTTNMAIKIRTEDYEDFKRTIIDDSSLGVDTEVFVDIHADGRISIHDEDDSVYLSIDQASELEKILSEKRQKKL